MANSNQLNGVETMVKCGHWKAATRALLSQRAVFTKDVLKTVFGIYQDALKAFAEGKEALIAVDMRDNPKAESFVTVAPIKSNTFDQVAVIEKWFSEVLEAKNQVPLKLLRYQNTFVVINYRDDVNEVDPKVVCFIKTTVIGGDFRLEFRNDKSNCRQLDIGPDHIHNVVAKAVGL